MLNLKDFAPNDQVFSSKYTFLYNDYNWLNSNNDHSFTIQSLVVSAPFFNLKKDLKILNQLNEYKDLGFELLVQRDIDKKRVEIDMVDNYLSLSDKIKFFPPIVVALIPSYRSVGNVEFATKFFTDNSKLKLEVGEKDIQQEFYLDQPQINDLEDFKKFFKSRDVKYGSLMWDLEKFNAIVIDGQHRFYALQKYVEKNHPLELSKCFFPVNFVLVTPEPGQVIGAEQYIKISRELFIDINKNAKPVSHNRQILLDDIDLIRYTTRNSIKQYNITDKSKLFDWKNSENNIEYLEKIPQSIVNWNSDQTEGDRENFKYFKLSQLTSTSLLYRILSDFIMKPSNDSEKNNKFEVLYRVFELNSFLPVTDDDKEIINGIIAKRKKFEDQLKSINEEIQSSEDTDTDREYLEDYFNRKKIVLNEKALSFDLKTNRWLSNWFYTNTKFGKAFTMFFSAFKPYQNIIKAVEPIFKDNSKNKPIINFLIDPDKKSKNDYLQNLSNDNLEITFSNLYDQIENIKNEIGDARNLVFQKAVFADFNKVIDLLEQLRPTYDINTQLALYFDALSALYEKNLFDRSLSISFDGSELFKDSVKGEFSYKKVKIWTNVWINDQNDTIVKARDVDAFKIGELIRILAVAQMTQKTLPDLRSQLGNRIAPSITQIKNAYKATFLKEIKEKYELGSLNEAKSYILDDYKFNEDLERIISTSIEKYILDKVEMSS